MPFTFAGFLRGVSASIPVWLAVAPFGLIFGAVATEAGLDLIQAMAMTTIVIAGASQFVVLSLLADHAPAIVAILAGVVVNLRMAMYSASLAVHWRGAPLWTRAFAAYVLHDQAYALSIRRYAEAPEEPLADKVGFFFGVGVATVAVWIAGSLAGALLGARAPDAWSLDFAVPVMFIAVAAPFLRGLPNLAAATVAVVAALVFAFLPYGLGLLVASALGVVAGASMETWLARERPA